MKEKNKYDKLVDLMESNKECTYHDRTHASYQQCRRNRLEFLKEGCLNGSVRCCYVYWDSLKQGRDSYTSYPVKQREVDTIVYKTLKEDYKKRIESNFLEVWNEYLRFLVNEISVTLKLEDYEEYRIVLLQAYELLKQDKLKPYDFDGLGDSFVRICYVYSHIKEIKSREKCKECLIVVNAYYKWNGYDDIEVCLLKGLCYTDNFVDAMFMTVNNDVFKRFNLLKEDKYDEFLDLIDWN